MFWSAAWPDRSAPPFGIGLPRIDRPLRQRRDRPGGNRLADRRFRDTALRGIASPRHTYSDRNLFYSVPHELRFFGLVRCLQPSQPHGGPHDTLGKPTKNNASRTPPTLSPPGGGFPATAPASNSRPCLTRRFTAPRSATAAPLSLTTQFWTRRASVVAVRFFGCIVFLVSV